MVEELIDRYYPEAGPPYAALLRHILVTHSRCVAELATDIARRHPELGADRQFLWEGAMLHDIGIYLTNAPGIQCHGTEPYIRHGLLGGVILRREGFPLHARVAERHTGTGLTIDTIRRQNLPLPLQDFSPQTIEEQIICYADKFFSKSRLEQQKTQEQVLRSLEKFGPEGVVKMQQWMQKFA